MGWRRVILSTEERGNGAGQNLKVDFEIAFIAAGVPEAAALFVEPADSADPYYFSPEDSRISGSERDAVPAASFPSPPERRVNIAAGDRWANKPPSVPGPSDRPHRLPQILGPMISTADPAYNRYTAL